VVVLDEKGPDVNTGNRDEQRPIHVARNLRPSQGVAWAWKRGGGGGESVMTRRVQKQKPCEYYFIFLVRCLISES